VIEQDRAAALPALCRAAGALLALASCVARPGVPRGEPANASGGSGWQERYDLDGDGVRDRIEVGSTGGAHCCYTLAIVSGRTGVRTALTFELDGGYPGGLDLSQPERFAVTTAPLGAARLVIEVATYGGEPQPPLVGSRVLPSGGIGVSLGRSKTPLCLSLPRLDTAHCW
jgi:hypothetical protein